MIVSLLLFRRPLATVTTVHHQTGSLGSILCMLRRRTTRSGWSCKQLDLFECHSNSHLVDKISNEDGETVARSRGKQGRDPNSIPCPEYSLIRTLRLSFPRIEPQRNV